MPLHAFSSGSSVNVPLDVTFTLLQPPSQPSNAFCQPFMCRQPPPMGSNGSPYSLCVQVLLGASMNVDPPHAIDDECCMPKLCPGSCTSTTQPSEALYQVSRCGRAGEPSDASPDHA